MSKTTTKFNDKYKKFRDFYDEDEPSNKRQKQKFYESKKYKDRLRHELRKGNFHAVDDYES